MNVQALIDPWGHLLWSSAARPGATHDLAAARAEGLITELTETGVTYADKDYQGAGGMVVTPVKGRDPTESSKEFNRGHAQLRARANAPSPNSNVGSCYVGGAVPTRSPNSSPPSTSFSTKKQDEKG